MKYQKAYQTTVKPKIHTGDGLTEQAHKNQTDMNYILREYQKTGLIRHAKENQGRYDDVSPTTFHDAMVIVADSKSMFNELPSNIRKEFGNNPEAFLSFVQNPASKERMQQLGILKGNDGLDISGAKTNAPVPTADPLPTEPVPTSL